MRSDNDGSSRRGFFREAGRKLIGPVADYIEKRTGPLPPSRRGLPILRPPGAISSDRFADTCQRCGACVEVCPANAIVALDESFGNLSGTPVVNPDTSACVICDGLQCTHVCPSGALLPLESADEIDMGLAEVYAGMCVRSREETCTLCVDRCPIGVGAITFRDEGPPLVFEDGCTGCGICQMYCPTTPKAIMIRPK